MKTRLIPSALLATALIGLIATTGWSEEKTDTEKKAHPLGAEHTLLGEMVGEWDVAGEWFMPGSDQGMPYTGTAKGTWVVGNKFLQMAFETQLPQGKLEVTSIMGYSQDDKKFQAVSMNSMRSGMITTEPKWDAETRCWTSTFETTGMMGKITARQVLTVNKDGGFTMMTYSKPAGQEGAKESLQNKLTYTAKK